MGDASRNDPLPPPPAVVEPVRIRTGLDRIHIEAALALHIHGTFRKAAEALSMKPATVNRRIRDLEFLVGVRLFERQRRRAVATRLGQRFVRECGRALVNLHDMIAAMRRISSGQAGEVVIGYHGPIGSGPLHDLLFGGDPDLGEICPVPVEFASGNMFDAVAGEAIDLALVHGGTGSFRGKVETLWHERVVAVLRHDHPLALRSQLRWSDLAGQLFLMPRRDPADEVRRLLAQRLPAHHGGPRVRTMDVSLQTIFMLVEARNGIGLCLESSFAAAGAGIVARPVHGEQGEERIAASLCWRDDHDNPALDRMLTLLRRRLAAGAGRGGQPA